MKRIIFIEDVFSFTAGSLLNDTPKSRLNDPL